MKNLFIFILLIISTLSAFAQQATVIDSKSLTIPRYADLGAIQGIPEPQVGMMVYNLQSSSNWLYDGAQWKNTADGVSQWINNAGNISFGNGNTFSNSLNVPIQNNTQINSGINVPISGTITNPVQVTIFISLGHTRAADLRIGITLPDNTFILLCENAGGIDDFVSSNTISFNHNAALEILFSGISNGIVPQGIYLPSGFPAPNELAALNGKSINGNWQLSVLDMNNNTDLGTWVSWGISFGIPRKVGINTPNPTESLEVVGKTKTSQLQLTQDAAAIPLQFNPVIGARKIAFSNSINDNQFDGFGTRLTGSGSEIAYNVFSAASSAHTFYSGIDANNVKELLRIKGNGEVSLGLGPNARLKFAEQDYSRKIILSQSSLVNNDNQFMGFGINSNLGESSLRYQVSALTDAHIFYSGNSSSTSLELFKIRGNGNIGVNQSSPKSKLEVNGALATTMTKVNSNITLDNSASVYYFLDKVEATLPDPTTCANRRYVLSNRDDNNIQILGYAIEALDGTSITEILPAIAVEIISDGSNWLQIK